MPRQMTVQCLIRYRKFEQSQNFKSKKPVMVERLNTGYYKITFPTLFPTFTRTTPDVCTGSMFNPSEAFEIRIF